MTIMLGERYDGRFWGKLRGRYNKNTLYTYMKFTRNKSKNKNSVTCLAGIKALMR